MIKLFRSRATYAILDTLSRDTKRSYYLTELANEIDKDVANLTRELARLVPEGLVKVNTRNSKKFYRFNTNNRGARELIKVFAAFRADDFEGKFNTVWLLGEDIPNIAPFFSKIWLNCFVDEFGEHAGRAYQKIAAVYRGYNLRFYYDKDDALAVAETIVSRFVKEPAYMQKVNDEIITSADALRSFCANLPEQNLNRLTDRELWRFYAKHEELHTIFYQWAWIPVAADIFTSSLTEAGRKVLRDHGVTNNKINDYLSVLTVSPNSSLIDIERDELTKLAITIQKNKQQCAIFVALHKQLKEYEAKRFGLYTESPEYEKLADEKISQLVAKINPAIIKRLEKHYTTYFYTKFIYTEEQGVYSLKHYLQELVYLVNQTPDLSILIDNAHRQQQTSIQARERIIKQIGLKPEWHKFFSSWGEFMVTKTYRRYAQLFALYKIKPIVEEIGRRSGLTLKQARFMTFEEVKQSLQGEPIDTDAIKSRLELCVYYADKNEQKFYTGTEAHQAITYLKSAHNEPHVLSGQAGSYGHAIGTAHVIKNTKQKQSIQSGGILVMTAVNSDDDSLVATSAGLVVEQGGLTSVGAKLARQHRIPSLFGVTDATAVIQDGDTIEVDAINGKLRILK